MRVYGEDTDSEVIHYSNIFSIGKKYTHGTPCVYFFLILKIFIFVIIEPVSKSTPTVAVDINEVLADGSHGQLNDRAYCHNH